MNRRASIVPGLILLALGIAFLGSTNGWWNLDWRQLAALWPVLLIVLGIRMLLPASRWADWLTGVVIALGLVAFLAIPLPLPGAWTNSVNNGVHSNISRPDDQDITNLNFSVDVAASDFKLKALDESSPLLYSSDARGPRMTQTFGQSDGTATVKLSPESGANWFAPGRKFDVALSRRPALDVSLNTGASDAKLDFSELNLSSLTMRGGASDVEVTLGSRGARQTLSFQGGASDITVKVPQGAALKLTKNGGLTSDNFDKLGLTGAGDTFTSAGFDAAPLQIIITFQGGASSIKIDRY